MQLRIDSYSSQGQRPHQEDRYYADPARGLAAVADGLGGHPDGELAAQAGIDAVHAASVPMTKQSMIELFSAAHAAVRALDICRVTKSGHHKLSCDCLPPGSTLSVLWVGDNTAILGHIGDTRIWHLRDKCSALRTTDHHGGWSGHSLTRALGISGDGADILPLPVAPGDVFVLLSDGVLLAGDNLLNVVNTGPWDGVAQRVVEEGMKQYSGCHAVTDNATAVVVRLEG